MDSVTPSRRMLLTVEYDGTAYCGWQWQQNGPSIQQALETALQTAEQKPVRVTGASRTDAGVHARGQCAHFDTASSIPDEKYPFVLNTLLPWDIRVTGARRVGADFHARFCASGKEYTYHIFNRRHASALNRRFCAHVPLPLDTAAMADACAALVGEHDFAAFAASGGSAKTTTRRIDACQVSQDGCEIMLRIRGNAFLYNMVRIIAGTLIQVGLHELPQDVFKRAIASGDRLALGPTAPACGLCLEQVFYPEGV